MSDRFITKQEVIDSIKQTQSVNELFKISEKKITDYVNKNFDNLKKEFLAKQKVNIKGGKKTMRRKGRRKKKTRKRKQKGGLLWAPLIGGAFILYLGVRLARDCMDPRGLNRFDPGHGLRIGSDRGLFNRQRG